LNSRKRTFLIATSVSGRQFRMMLGHLPRVKIITKPLYFHFTRPQADRVNSRHGGALNIHAALLPRWSLP
jgi:hypothetical protein